MGNLMRLDELKPSHAKMLSRNKFSGSTEEWLRRRGYTKLDQGKFSTVYNKPGSNIAIKFNYRPDPCYMKFVDYALKNKNNPHLPKMSPLRQIGVEEFIIFMEKLEKFTYKNDELKIISRVSAERWTKTIEEIEDRIRHNITTAILFNDLDMDEDKLNQEVKKQTNYILEKYSLWFETILEIKTRFVDMDCHWDMHPGNMMIRPGSNTLVITDPLS